MTAPSPREPLTAEERYVWAWDTLLETSENLRRALQIVRDERNAIRARLAAVEQERDTLRTFVGRIIREGCWGVVDIEWDGGSMQDEAEKLGILVRTPHSHPEDIEGCMGCEYGTDFLFYFAWSDEVRAPPGAAA